MAKFIRNIDTASFADDNSAIRFGSDRTAPRKFKDGREQQTATKGKNFKVKGWGK